MKLFATTLLTGALALSAANAQEVTIRLAAHYGDESERVPVDYALAKLKELMPEVTVSLERVPQGDDYNAKVLAAAASNTLPDVFGIDGGLFTQLAEAGKIADMTSVVEAEGLPAKYSAAWQPFIYNYDGKSYLLPDQGSWTASLFYNTKVFADAGVTPPTNFAELLEATKALAAKGYTPMTVPADANWMLVQVLDGLVTREDPRGLMALQAGARLSEPVFRKAVDSFKELIDAGLVGPRAANYDESLNLLKTDKAAMIMNGAWMMADLVKNMPDTSGRLGLPFGETSGQGVVNASGGPAIQGFAVAASGENVEVAKKFAAWFSYYVAEAKVTKRANPSPFSDSSIKYEGELMPMQVAYFEEAAAFETLTVFPWGLDRGVSVLLSDTMGEFATGSMSADDFVANVDAALDRAP